MTQLTRQGELMLDSDPLPIEKPALSREIVLAGAAGVSIPRVFYDAQAFLSPNGGTGKGVYLRNFVAPYADQLFGVASKGENYAPHRLIQGGFSRYHLWHQLWLPYLLHKERADFFLAPYNTAPLLLPSRTRLILVLHDLILLGRPNESKLTQRIDNEFRRLLIPRAVSRAHIVVTVSLYVKRQIEARFPSANVRLIPNTIAESWFVGDQVRSLQQRENYILTVTSEAPHKNTRRAFEAYARFVQSTDRSTAPSLRVVGLEAASAEYRQLAQSLGIADLVIFEQFLAEQDLRNLYRNARAVIVPSLAEGFGITVLEGMASGTPVLVSFTASLPEVAGAAAAYFDPSDVDSMSEALKQVLADPARQEIMVEQGLIQARQYHPEVVGRQIRAFWDELLGR